MIAEFNKVYDKLKQKIASDAEYGDMRRKAQINLIFQHKIFCVLPGRIFIYWRFCRWKQELLLSGLLVRMVIR